MSVKFQLQEKFKFVLKLTSVYKFSINVSQFYHEPTITLDPVLLTTYVWSTPELCNLFLCVAFAHSYVTDSNSDVKKTGIFCWKELLALDIYRFICNFLIFSYHKTKIYHFYELSLCIISFRVTYMYYLSLTISQKNRIILYLFLPCSNEQELL